MQMAIQELIPLADSKAKRRAVSKGKKSYENERPSKKTKIVLGVKERARPAAMSSIKAVAAGVLLPSAKPSSRGVGFRFGAISINSQAGNAIPDARGSLGWDI